MTIRDVRPSALTVFVTIVLASVFSADPLRIDSLTGPLAEAQTAWPNEPAGFSVYNDNPWDQVGDPDGEYCAPSGWCYLRRPSCSGGMLCTSTDTIVGDATALLSPPNGLRIVVPTNLDNDSQPSVHWLGLSSKPSEIYVGWWMKVSSEWNCPYEGQGCGKITMLFPDDDNLGGGVTYTGLFPGPQPRTYYVNVATTWVETGYKFWDPNVVTTYVNDDTWFQVEWHVKWPTLPLLSDGVIEWWVNGELNGLYTNVPFPAIPGFLELQYAISKLAAPPVEQYLYVDHTRVSTP